jgi:23S rRNA (adenine2503-C2)-methyltransferase
MKKNILDFSKEELKSKFGFRAKQLYHWIYQKEKQNFSEMENLPKKLRAELEESYKISNLETLQKQEASDGTVKYLFRLPDGRTVETVLIRMREERVGESGDILQQARYTVCVSTQVGCKVGCSFCLTAKGGFVRDLSAGEIVEQVLTIRRELQNSTKENVVYMGMGEPLDNFDNLVKAINILQDENGLAIAPRRQTVSTSGISTKIDKLGSLDLGVHIAISLHAVDDEVRTELIPMNKAFNIQSIIDAVQRFPYDNRKRVMFEYLVIRNVNDSLQSAKKLLKLLDGIKAKINLIYFNPHEGSEFQRPTEKSMMEFADYLNQRGLLATIRASKGIDISAACGQLREQNL